MPFGCASVLLEPHHAPVSVLKLTNLHLVHRLSRKIRQRISLCGEIMKLGTLVGNPCRIIYRLGPNSETPPGGHHLEF